MLNIQKKLSDLRTTCYKLFFGVNDIEFDKKVYYQRQSNNLSPSEIKWLNSSDCLHFLKNLPEIFVK